MTNAQPVANTNDLPAAPIVKRISVAAPIEVAFAVFASEMSSWWDLEHHHIGAAKAVAAIVEPRVNGRWFETGEDGSECDWGRVLAYEPPTRLLLTWQISAEWKFDPNLYTEVEITFASDAGGTLVTLEHRGLEQYGPAAAAMRAMLVEGWPRTLEAFAGAIKQRR